MCGICGAVALAGDLDPAIRYALPAMTDALAARGPDGRGEYADRRAILGHRRLAILDLAGGAQPMANEDRSIRVVLNGEIYNHAAIRSYLAGRGHVFRTRSDTEVIVHAYEDLGARAVEVFEGMFALAVYDSRRGELLLARDRLGKKPLYHAVLGDALHFASEIKALRASPAWEGQADMSSLEGYLSLGYSIAPATFYRGVYQLEPGHWLRLRRGGWEIRRYWDILEFDADDRTGPEIERDLDRRLAESVAARLESDVPLGAFLSGGIDSGLIVSYMAERLPEPVRTTTVGFADRSHDETHAASLTARRWGTDHTRVLVEPRPGEVLESIVSAFDEPFADSSAVPTSYLMSAVRERVTVALSGDGGDELFGGYPFRYVPHAREARLRELLGVTGARRLLGLVGSWWPRSRRVPRLLRWGSILENLGRAPEDAYYLDLCFLKPWDARRLLGLAPDRDPRASPVHAAVTTPYRSCPSGSPLQKAQLADLRVYLPNDVLVKVDRLSMLHGLEVRCPLLDRKIVEFAFRLPTEAKMPGLSPKHLLRRLAGSRLPPELLRLPKHGFTAPVARWFAGAVGDQFREEVLGRSARSSALVDRRCLGDFLDEHRRGTADRSHALWAVWVLERWLRRESCGDREPSAAARVVRSAT